MRWAALLLVVATSCAPNAVQTLTLQLDGSEGLRVRSAAQLTVTLLHGSPR